MDLADKFRLVLASSLREDGFADQGNEPSAYLDEGVGVPRKEGKLGKAGNLN